MKPKDWFGLGVRFVGIWCAIQAWVNGLYFLEVRLGFSQMRSSYLSFQGADNSPVSYLMYAAGYAATAAYFLLGTAHLTSLTYRDGDTTQDPMPPNAGERNVESKSEVV